MPPTPKRQEERSQVSYLGETTHSPNPMRGTQHLGDRASNCTEAVVHNDNVLGESDTGPQDRRGLQERDVGPGGVGQAEFVPSEKQLSVGKIYELEGADSTTFSKILPQEGR